MNGRRWDLLVLFAWTVLIFVGGSAKLPGPALVAPPIGWDKVAHLLGFFLTQRIAARALRHDLGGRPVRVAVAGGLVSAALGGLLELYQATLPHRSADIWDFVADALGAGLGVLLAVYGARERSRAVRDE
jgi:VanZ family protein